MGKRANFVFLNVESDLLFYSRTTDLLLVIIFPPPLRWLNSPPPTPQQPLILCPPFTHSVLQNSTSVLQFKVVFAQGSQIVKEPPHPTCTFTLSSPCKELHHLLLSGWMSFQGSKVNGINNSAGRQRTLTRASHTNIHTYLSDTESITEASVCFENPEMMQSSGFIASMCAAGDSVSNAADF